MVESRIIHPNIQLTDVTEQFRNAVKKLQSGQLIKDEHFTLYEAVGALEIGDPKMDSGCFEAEEEIEDEFNISAPISEEEVIWLIDELVCREAAWHSGYPLSQTLFTSVHLDRILWPDPKLLDEAHFIRDQRRNVSTPLHNLLRSYCLGLIKSCDLVLKLVTSQHYYEEEDFATQLFNREMLRRFPVEEVLSTMRQSLEDFALIGENLKLNRILTARLQYRLAVLEMLNGNLTGKNVPQTQHEINLSVLDEIESSGSFGKPISNAFNIRIQRRLASSVPPRPMISFERENAFKFFRQFLSDAFNAFEVFEVNHSLDLMKAYWNFMLQVPQPSVYNRALLQSFLSMDDRILGRFSPKEFIFQDLQLLLSPASPILDVSNESVETPSDPRFQIANHMNEFITKIGQSYLNQYRTFCLNRCRVRRTLCHAAIEWDQLQADAEELDGVLQSLTREQPQPYPIGGDLTYSYSLSSWIYHYKLMQLRLVVQLGFDLSIHAAHESAQMYWYLSHICDIHLGHLERISHFISIEPQTSLQHNKNAQRAESQVTLRHLYREFTWLKATESLARALHRVFILLQRHGHFTKTKPAYASEELRFELRMRPYQHLSIPEPLQYEDIQKLSSLKHFSDSDLLDQAARMSLTARKAWEEILKDGWNSQPLRQPKNLDVSDNSGRIMVIEGQWIQDVRNSMKACIGTSILVSTLSKILQQDVRGNGDVIKALKLSISPVGDRDRFHSSWPIPKMVQ